jgi:hypothetical protein
MTLKPLSSRRDSLGLSVRSFDGLKAPTLPTFESQQFWQVSGCRYRRKMLHAGAADRTGRNVLRSIMLSVFYFYIDWHSCSAEPHIPEARSRVAAKP